MQITSRTSGAVSRRENGWWGADDHVPTPVSELEPRIPRAVGKLSCGDRHLLLPGRYRAAKGMREPLKLMLLSEFLFLV